METIKPNVSLITPRRLEKILNEEKADHEFFKARDRGMERKAIDNILSKVGGMFQ